MAAALVGYPEPDTFDPRELDHVSQVDENLICSICHCVMIKPIMTTPCRHIFCLDCLGKACGWQALGRCPYCRTHVRYDQLTAAPPALVSLIDGLRVRCFYWKRGCPVITARENAERHIRECGYVKESCVSVTCSQTTLRKDLHLGCVHRSVECKYCRKSILKADLQKHHDLECIMNWTRCGRCHLTMLRSRTTSHDADECVNAILTCPGYGIGCRSAKVKRSKMWKHLGSCPAGQFAQNMEKQTQKLGALERENRLLNGKIRELESKHLLAAGRQAARDARLQPQTVGVNHQRRHGGAEVTGADIRAAHDHHPSRSGAAAVNESRMNHLSQSYMTLRADLDRLQGSVRGILDHNRDEGERVDDVLLELARITQNLSLPQTTSMNGTPLPPPPPPPSPPQQQQGVLIELESQGPNSEASTDDGRATGLSMSYPANYGAHRAFRPFERIDTPVTHEEIQLSPSFLSASTV